MKNPKITEEEIILIKEAQQGSEVAFNRIFKKYKGFVDSILYSHLKDKDEAKDLTNIVFLKVYDKLSKFTSYESFGGWLRILAKNTAIDYLRTVKDKVSIDDDQRRTSLQVSDDIDETTTINKLTHDQLTDLIDTLPPSYREVCKLYYVEDLTVSQISAALNIPTGTIKSYLFRMRKLLKKQLKIY